MVNFAGRKAVVPSLFLLPPSSFPGNEWPTYHCLLSFVLSSQTFLQNLQNLAGGVFILFIHVSLVALVHYPLCPLDVIDLGLPEPVDASIRRL